MPLLTFKYLPLRGAQIETLQIDWIKKEVKMVVQIATDGRVGRATVQFSDVHSVNIGLDRTKPQSGVIESCSEAVDTFRFLTKVGETVSVTASRYTLV